MKNWKMMGSRPVSPLAISVMNDAGFNFTPTGWKSKTKKRAKPRAKR